MRPRGLCGARTCCTREANRSNSVSLTLWSPVYKCIRTNSSREIRQVTTGGTHDHYAIKAFGIWFTAEKLKPIPSVPGCWDRATLPSCPFCNIEISAIIWTRTICIPFATIDWRSKANAIRGRCNLTHCLAIRLTVRIHSPLPSPRRVGDSETVALLMGSLTCSLSGSSVSW